MQREDLVFAGICDWGGVVRGKGFPAADIETRLTHGIGVTEAYITTPCFGAPVPPSPVEDDLILLPDPAAHVAVEFDDASAERFYLGDVLKTDGTPWEGCPRDFLKRAIVALEGFGLSVHASFAQEFVYSGSEDRPVIAYAFGEFRHQSAFAEALMGSLGSAGLRADGFRPTKGAGQFEVSVAAEPALRAADAAIILREMTRGVAWRFGKRAAFAPAPSPAHVSNATEIHLSLWEKTNPVGYDPDRPFGVSERAAPFVAGVLAHAPAIVAFSAPSVASYFRPSWRDRRALRIDLGVQEQGVAIRPAPSTSTPHDTPARQFNLIFNAADAACCPYLALGALIWAGADGLARGLALAEPDVAAPLPRDLDAALAALTGDKTVEKWWSKTAIAAYVASKRAEIGALEGADEATVCRRYGEVY